MKSFPEKIFSCWHPIAYSHEVSNEPKATKLLGEHLVIWRNGEGVAHVMQDLCIHRGTALSLGWTTDTEIVCPYHGWRYGETGKCTVIPQKASTTIPTKARVTSYQSIERYGLIWANLRDEPLYDLPEIPEFETDGWKLVNTGPYDWNSDASRQVENFTDFGHFPWVHPGLLGDVDRPIVDDYTVTVEDHVLHYSVVRPEAANTDDFPVFANEDVVKPERRSRYELHCPYTIVLRLGWGGEKGMVYFFVSQPISENECRGYCIIGRNYDLEQPDTVLQGFEDTIFGQDKRIVESQRPEQVPFDLADELHLKFDAVAINYRRTMHAEGLDYYHYLDIAD